MRLFDIHCDTLTECYRKRESLCHNSGHVDLRRGRQYVPWCQVFAVWIPDTLRGKKAFRYGMRVLNFAQRQERRFPQQLVWVRDRDSLEFAVRTGRCAGLLTVEGGAVLGGQPKRLARLAEAGVRLVTLTWNGDNELGCGCLSKTNGGLTAVGKQVVRLLPQYGMVADVSHLNEAGFWDVATVSDTAFIASHSLSRTVREHPRNLTDAQFKEIRRRGGLVGLSLCGEHLGEHSFDAVYRHLSHYLSLGGEHCVAFGGDLDGTDLPETWEDVCVLETLCDYLLKKGVPETVLDRLFFQNAFEFFSATLQAEEDAVK